MTSRKSNKNNTLIKTRICLVDISSLKAHERTDEKRLKNLKDEIWFDGIIKKPIVVDEKTNTIIDGHHRVEALKMIGCTKIPVCYVDYMCDIIGLKSMIKNVEITKDRVLEAALNSNLFKPKSTWHYIRFPNLIKHISCIQRRVDISLESLK